MVPVSCSGLTPCSSAATTYMASTGNTAPFMVMDTDTLERSMSSNKTYVVVLRGKGLLTSLWVRGNFVCLL